MNRIPSRIDKHRERARCSLCIFKPLFILPYFVLPFSDVISAHGIRGGAAILAGVESLAPSCWREHVEENL